MCIAADVYRAGQRLAILPIAFGRQLSRHDRNDAMTPSNTPKTENKAAWWAQRLLIAACAASIVAGFFIEHHPHFAFEAWPGFFAAFGFAAYCFIVLSAKALRPLLHRPETYYGDDAGSNGDTTTNDKQTDNQHD